MHKLLITGVAGFLGRYIARHFHENGWTVIGLDVRPPENAPLGELTRYVRLSLPDLVFTELIQDEQPDVCIHCAGRASVGLSVQDPDADYVAGPPIVFTVLDTLRKFAPDCKFLFLSSAAVYGNPQELPVSETAPAAPISPYGYHKWQGELLCQEFARIYHLPTASARIFSAYGPGLRRQVMWDICRKALEQQPLHLFGTGQESRDFIHALDIARGLEVIAARGALQGEVYNLASGQEITIRALAEGLVAALGLEPRLSFDGHVPEGDPRNWRADMRQLGHLGFQPQISLDKGLQAYARWCRAELTGE